MSKKELNQWRDSLTFAERARLRKAIEKLGEEEGWQDGTKTI